MILLVIGPPAAPKRDELDHAAHRLRGERPVFKEIPPDPCAAARICEVPCRRPWRAQHASLRRRACPHVFAIRLRPIDLETPTLPTSSLTSCSDRSSHSQASHRRSRARYRSCATVASFTLLTRNWNACSPNPPNERSDLWQGARRAKRALSPPAGCRSSGDGGAVQCRRPSSERLVSDPCTLSQERTRKLSSTWSSCPFPGAAIGVGSRSSVGPQPHLSGPSAELAILRLICSSVGSRAASRAVDVAVKLDWVVADSVAELDESRPVALEPPLLERPRTEAKDVRGLLLRDQSRHRQIRPARGVPARPAWCVPGLRKICVLGSLGSSSRRERWRRELFDSPLVARGDRWAAKPNPCLRFIAKSE